MSGKPAVVRGPEPADPTAEAMAGVTGYRLRRLHAQWIAHWGRWFRRAGLEITPMQGGILLLVDENPGLTQIALARLLRIEPPTLSQALSPLVDLGLIQRYRATGDGRAVALHLSRAGTDAVESARGAIADHEDDLLAGLTDAERAQLISLLDKALASADRAFNDSAGRNGRDSADTRRRPGVASG